MRGPEEAGRQLQQKKSMGGPSVPHDSAYADEADELGGLADGGIGLKPSGIGLIQLVDELDRLDTIWNRFDSGWNRLDTS